MALSVFDPEANKVVNAYGGFDPNEKGLVQYPKPSKSGAVHLQPHSRYEDFDLEHTLSNPILDPVTRHYRRFVQDPSLPKCSDRQNSGRVEKSTSDRSSTEIQPSSCGNPKMVRSSSAVAFGRRKPIDPVHWRPDLFDTRYEKYYLRNIINEDPFRPFLTDYRPEGITEETQHYITEYKQRYSGNPVMSSSQSGKPAGFGHPSNLPEPCDCRRNQTSKLRDAIFTHEKEPTNSHLDYNDPKRYNPWPRLRMSYAQMLEGNYRPRPGSGVDYSLTTLLPAISPHSKLWII